VIVARPQRPVKKHQTTSSQVVAVSPGRPASRDGVAVPRLGDAIMGARW